jgi:hypothetical protein
MPATDERIQSAPLPTDRERRRRRNPAIQFARFVSLSLGILRLARRHD